MSKGLRRVRYAIADAFFGLGHLLGRILRLIARVPIALGRGFAGFWRSLSVIARRRLVAALAVAAALLLFLALAVPNLPCQFPGGDTCPPADDAVGLVPDDALAYLHANLDPDTDQYAAASELASRTPVFSAQIAARATALIPAPRGSSPDFSAEIEPWFGGEAATAVIAAAGAPERVDLLEVADAEGATSYAESVAAGVGETEDYEGVEVTTDQRGVATAQVEGFLVIGSGDGVRAVIATATDADGAAALADDQTATEVRDELPEHRFAEVWLSEDGVAELIGDTGLLGTLTPLIAPGATRGVAASLSASGDSIELAVRSALDPEREQASPSFFAAFPAFEPKLAERLRPGSLAYLGIGDPAKTVTALLTQASAQAPGIAASFEDLVANLQQEGGVDIQGQLLDALGEEAAVAVEPAAGDGAVAEAGSGLPYLMFVADGVDEEAVRQAFASLQGPLAAAVDPGSDLQAPVFGDQEIAGVTVRSITVSPTVELAYAVFDGLAAVATDPAGIAGLAGDEGGLDGARLYERATDDFPDEVSLLAFLNLGALVEIGELGGLAEDPLYATFAGDFRRLEALGLAVSSDDDLLSTDGRLLLSAEAAPEEAPAPSAAPSD